MIDTLLDCEHSFVGVLQARDWRMQSEVRAQKAQAEFEQGGRRTQCLFQIPFLEPSTTA